MSSVNVVFNDIMMSGYDTHREALDIILAPGSDGGIGNHSVRFVRGFTRATCAIIILTCAIRVLKDEPELVHHCQSVVPILESCVNLWCNCDTTGKVDKYFKMLGLPHLFPCCSPPLRLFSSLLLGGCGAAVGEWVPASGRVVSRASLRLPAVRAHACTPALL